VASEALQNIRTVRAFSTELMEIRKYTGFIGESLRNGIRDAWGAAGTYALTNYLDLGAGIAFLIFFTMSMFYIVAVVRSLHFCTTILSAS
jgi:hypothetical protein